MWLRIKSTVKQKKLISRAAESLGITTSKFVLDAAVAEATKVLQTSSRWLEHYDRIGVTTEMTEEDALRAVRRLENRNYSGRAFEINQRNSRQLQLDVEAALKLCRYFAERG